MSVPPAATAAGPVFVIARSAVAVAVAADVDELFDGLGSVVALVTFAVFDNVAPLAIAELERMVMLNAAEAPTASEAMLQVIVPPAPTAGFVHVNAGPDVCASDTNVDPVGMVSVSATVCASLGPVLPTVTV